MGGKCITHGKCEKCLKYFVSKPHVDGEDSIKVDLREIG
jgi:hypothetical protein